VRRADVQLVGRMSVSVMHHFLSTTIADNRLAQNAHWDERLLGESLLELKELDRDFDLSIRGYTAARRGVP